MDCSSGFLASGASRSSTGPCHPLAPSLLLALPGPAARALTGALSRQDRHNLRLACQAAAALVDSCALRLKLTGMELLNGGVQLHQRFSSVKELSLLPDTSSKSSKKLSSSSSTSRQAHPKEPWTSVTSLTMFAWPMCPQLQATLAHFTNIEQLSLSIPSRVNKGLDQLLQLCRQLPRLVSVSVSFHSCWLAKLLVPELQQLQSLPALTALEASLHDLSDAAWATLQRMQALRSLSIISHCEQPRTAGDLRSLTALTHLDWTIESPYADVMDSLEHSSEAPTLTLQVPSSLVSLRLDHLPALPLPPLPQLTQLIILKQTLEPQHVVQLGQQCQQLACLEVPDLLISAACHHTPLRALTHLQQLSVADTAANTQYARAFPALQHLALRLHEMDNWGDPARFVSLTALTCLDVGGTGPRKDDGLMLEMSDFEALAALPGLHTLRLNMDASHICGIALLTQLSSLELVAYETYILETETPDLEDAFHNTSPPAHLHTVALRFFGQGWFACNLTMAGSADGGVGAATYWLASAPAVREVHWLATSCASGPFHCTGSRLEELAACSSIKRIVHSPLAGRVPVPADMQEKFAQQGIEVVETMN